MINKIPRDILFSDINQNKLESIKKGKTVILENKDGVFIVFLRSDCYEEQITIDDLIIRQIASK